MDTVTHFTTAQSAHLSACQKKTAMKANMTQIGRKYSSLIPSNIALDRGHGST